MNTETRKLAETFTFQNLARKRKGGFKKDNDRDKEVRNLKSINV